MVELTHEQADAIDTAINYEAQIAAIKSDRGAWLAAVRGFAKTELKRLGIMQYHSQNRLCNGVESQLEITGDLPDNYTGFKNYILLLREHVETYNREKPQDSAWKAHDTDTLHKIYCYRVKRENQIYRIFSRVTHTDFVIDDPAVIDQLDAIAPIKQLNHEGLQHSDYEVTWRLVAIEGTTNHRRQVVKVEKSTLSEDEKQLIRDMIACIVEQKQKPGKPCTGIEVAATIPDNVADRAMLESLFMRGWVKKTNQTNIPLAWTVTQRAAVEAEMTNTTDEIMFVSKEHERLCKLADLPYPPGMSDNYQLALILKVTIGDHLRDHGKDATLSVLKDFFNPLIAAATDRALAKSASMPLDEVFPRDESDEPPVSEGKMLSESKSYFAEINAILKARGLEAKTEVFRTRIQGGESASKIPIAKRDELLDKLEFILNDEYPNADSWKAWLNTNHVSKDVETPALLAKMGVQKLSEYKGTLAQTYDLLMLIRQNATQSNDEATPRNETKIDTTISGRTETPRIERSSAASQPDKSEGSQNHMEDIQIKNTHFESPVCVYPHDHGVIIYHGVKYVVTTREGATPAMVLDMLKSWDAMIQSGVFEIAQAGRVTVGAIAPLSTVASQPGTVAAPPQTPGVQTTQCVMIKAILSYEGQKPQLEFICNGMDKSLKFTKPVDKQLGLLTGIRKMDGSGFAPNDLQPNMMYPGNWLIDWKYSEDGKFRNVLAIRPALAQAA